MPKTSWVMGLPLAPFTMKDTLHAVNRLIDGRSPGFFITANLNYAMLSAADAEVQKVNLLAEFIVADGMPLVWASRNAECPLPERVAGSDLIFALAAESVTRGWRVALIGGAPGVAERAEASLADRYPGFEAVSIEVPPFRGQSASEEQAMIERIRAAEPDLLIGAFSQPFGEKWLAANVHRLGVPACVQLGASLDFAAGRVKRAPNWIARCGLEWGFRLAMEPRRLGGRYARNVRFLARQLLFKNR